MIKWILPDDLESHPTDSSDVFQWDWESSIPHLSAEDEIVYSPLDDPFELADCSASEEFPIMSRKNRARRQDDPAVCKPPTAVDETPSTDEKIGESPRDRRYLPDVLEKNFESNPTDWKAVTNKLWGTQNPFCHLYTAGVLPYGVCSSQEKVDMSMRVRINDVVFQVVHVSPCRIGMSMQPPSLPA